MLKLWCECGRGYKYKYSIRCNLCQRDKKLSVLTPLQCGILAFYAWGLSVKEIAAQRGCSFKTISEHLEAIKRKTHTRSGQELVRYAISNHLIPNVTPRSGSPVAGTPQARSQSPDRSAPVVASSARVSPVDDLSLVPA